MGNITDELNDPILDESGDPIEDEIGGIQISVSDTALGADVISSMLGSIFTSDLATGADVVSLFGDMIRTVLDTASGIDGVSGVTVQGVTIGDTSIGADEISDLLKGYLVQVFDAASAVDTNGPASVSAIVPDLATGAELVSGVAASLYETDTAIGTDVAIHFTPIADGTYIVKFTVKPLQRSFSARSL